ncbi:uncharacterized protein B0T23DRAFT_163880 [Neurospora hispaniola]|uniref:Myb-like DNA-binding domain-containing protein n=1 Tax=Neurospora hispaniola TaxID=588809 RepID=A0AAJ0MQ59_9PEZI|nr:hypothetical protein B0T23DRAFT_163880 [Neurospora hispaniola]
MSATENAMARFLFAILQQKSLKDIDWNEVAASPFLCQKISNGHAARMRYARFRASMLGTQPRPRNHTNTDENRVTKAKKKVGEKPKKKAIKVEMEKEDEVSKSKAASATMPSPPLKDEKDFVPPEPSTLDRVYSTPTSMANPTSDIQSRMQMRFLTPCSDSDAHTASPHICTRAAVTACPTEMLLGHPDTPFSFTTGSSTTTTTTITPTGPWQSTLPAYASYGMGYELDTYAMAFGVSDSQQNEQHAAEQLRVHATMMEHEDQTGMIKQEDWDAQRYQG